MQASNTMKQTGNGTTRDASESLTPQQQHAVELLMAGLTVSAVAEAVGVSRETVHRWRRQDRSFVAAMNRARRDAHEATMARLLSVWSKAADNLAAAVEQGDLKASLAVLRGIGMLEGEAPSIGSDDPEVLAENAEQAAVQTRTFREMSRMLVGM